MRRDGKRPLLNADAGGNCDTLTMPSTAWLLIERLLYLCHIMIYPIHVANVYRIEFDGFGNDDDGDQKL